MAADGVFDMSGISWVGSRDRGMLQLMYKKAKAHAFVERGYSVSWYPDGDGWMRVYLPERAYAKSPEIRAEAKFYSEPSPFGIRKGKVSSLVIMVSELNEAPDVLLGETKSGTMVYSFDRGLDVDHLHTDSRARELYDAILQELN